MVVIDDDSNVLLLYHYHMYHTDSRKPKILPGQPQALRGGHLLQHYHSGVQAKIIIQVI